MAKPTAAAHTFPYYDHRTVEEVLRDERDQRQQIKDLDSLSRLRALTYPESRKLELLLRKDAA